VKVDPENLTGIGQRKEIMRGIILIEGEHGKKILIKGRHE
jgi:hypothetical protein